MVDPIQRRRYARLLRALTTGRLTNDEYEDAVQNTIDTNKDEAICRIHRMAWHLYDDLCEHRLKGMWALERKTRREIARWLLFLYSDREFKSARYSEIWPFSSTHALEETRLKPVPFYRGQESLPEGLAPYQAGRLPLNEPGKPPFPVFLYTKISWWQALILVAGFVAGCLLLNTILGVLGFN